MMQFGLSTFGGVATGLVLVTGLADGGAAASGANQVTREFAGQASSISSASGYALREANNYPVTLLAAAVAAGVSVVEYHPLPVTATGMATIPVAQAQVDFSAYGTANGVASTQGAAYRFTKIYPYRAQAFAEGEADGQQWQMADPAPGLAFATGYGTTHHLTYGTGVASAVLEATAQFQIGVSGTALGTAECQGSALFQIGVAGLGLCLGEGNGDPAVTASGIRYFEVNGDTVAVAEAYAGIVGIHQAQTGWCVATAVGEARFQIGAKGIGQGIATGWSNALGLDTAVAAVAGLSNTIATGWASVLASGYGTGAVVASGAVTPVIIDTKVYPTAAQVTATAQMVLDALKSKVGNGLGSGVASTTILHVQQDVIPGQLTGMAQAQALLTQFDVRPAGILSQAMGYGTPLRTRNAGGELSATAVGQGFNNVNDLVRAPADRTYIEPLADRLVLVDVEPRTVLV